MFLCNLLVLSPVLQLPPLVVDGVVNGVVDGVVDGVLDAVRCFDCVQNFLHIRVQRLESQRGQTKNSICPLSFLLRTMATRRPHPQANLFPDPILDLSCGQDLELQTVS